MSSNLAAGELHRAIDANSAATVCAIYPRGRTPTNCDGGAEVLDAGTADRSDAGVSQSHGATTGCGCSAGWAGWPAVGLALAMCMARRRTR